jgi:uncharacterized Zn finger protein
MARLEFAILQYLDGKVRIALQRNDKELLPRLQARVREQLGSGESFHVKQIEKAIDKAFTGLVQEFKDETIRIV